MSPEGSRMLPCGYTFLPSLFPWIIFRPEPPTLQKAGVLFSLKCWWGRAGIGLQFKSFSSHPNQISERTTHVHLSFVLHLCQVGYGRQHQPLQLSQLNQKATLPCSKLSCTTSHNSLFNLQPCRSIWGCCFRYNSFHHPKHPCRMKQLIPIFSYSWTSHHHFRGKHMLPFRYAPGSFELYLDPVRVMMSEATLEKRFPASVIISFHQPIYRKTLEITSKLKMRCKKQYMRKQLLNV